MVASRKLRKTIPLFSHVHFPLLGKQQIKEMENWKILLCGSPETKLSL